MTKIKVSAFSTKEEQEKQATCTHQWEECHGWIFDYIEVVSKCRLCGSYLGPEGEKNDQANKSMALP